MPRHNDRALEGGQPPGGTQAHIRTFVEIHRGRERVENEQFQLQ